ncbi:hypothetical protein [Streptomyces halobius]|uniref:hypothetical protein n=1 Tax=Streptomyces halobius TaxID=2879846 RepID=UPI0024B17CC3|nr:hypothetical protein [Streptomyces halobius]
MHGVGDPDGQTGLAGPAGTGERQQTGAGQQPFRLGDLASTADEAGDIGRQSADAVRGDGFGFHVLASATDC